MAGKTALVTGATSGHGRALARALARAGAEVVVHGRSEDKCERVRREIADETGRTPRVLLADLSRRAEVDRAAEEVLSWARPLHVLANNAGLVWSNRTETPDGTESTIAVNYLAAFQLTVRLVPLLCRSAPARIVVVSSDTHRIARLDLDDLELRRSRYGMMKAYGRSKLALVYFTRELARRLRGTGVTANAVDPGPVQSDIGQNNPGLAARLLKGFVMERFFVPADRACDTALYLATSPEVEGLSGGYFRFMDRREPSLGRDPEGVAARLWELSARLTGADLEAGGPCAEAGGEAASRGPRRSVHASS